MFIGEFSNSVDAKGRVNIPASFRDTLRSHFGDEHIIVTRDARVACLRVYPFKEWQKLLAKLSGMPGNDRIIQAFTRVVVGAAQDCTPDKQGRILIPQSLRDFSALASGAVFLGANNTFEIWDKAAWDDHLKDSLALLGDADLSF